jgi:hypothetical protein
MSLIKPESSAGFSARLVGVAERLCELSGRAAGAGAGGGGASVAPAARDWPEVFPADAWAFAPELCSLYGTPAWHELDETRRRRLCFFEAVNFFSLNVHGEKALLEGLARRLYARRMGELTSYLHHFLAEENQHMELFGGFAWRYAGKLYADKKLAAPRDYRPGEEDLLFFARIVIFEEIVDVYNQRMSDDARLHPLVRAINHQHHLDETRHLAFGRLVVEELWARAQAAWSDDERAETRRYVAAFLEQTWKEYWNPDVYRDAGLAEPHALARSAFAHPAAQAHRDDAAGKVVRRFEAMGLLEPSAARPSLAGADVAPLPEAPVTKDPLLARLAEETRS